MPSDQARIMIWSTPRSLSTAFARSMSARGDTKLFWEPYLACYFYGPERKVHWAVDDKPGLLNEKYSFSYVNGLMGEPHPDSKVLFAKCMVEGIRSNFDVVTAPGYKHTFLIRNPLKMLNSLEKLCTVLPINFKETYMDIYQELGNFYDYVTDVLGQSAPPIIDADDLLAQPEAVLSKYCELVGIPFTPKMLKWETVQDPGVLNWECKDVGVISNDEYAESVILSNAFTSNGFGDGAKKQEGNTKTEFSADVKACAENAMPVYERLYNLRIKK